jgi:hypothetical protein
MNLIHQENRCRAASAGFGVGSTTLPKSGKRRVWFIASGVDCGIAKLGGDFKQQGGFANLPRPREKLDSAWRGFSEAFQEEIPAWYVVIREFMHSRIIIQIYLKNVKELTGSTGSAHRTKKKTPATRLAGRSGSARDSTASAFRWTEGLNWKSQSRPRSHQPRSRHPPMP